jgi:tellurite resistance protein
MGLGGLGLSWRKAADLAGAPAWPGEALMALAVLAWLLVLGLNAWRAISHPAAALEDWRHPFRAGFLAAGTIGGMVAAAALIPWAPGLARVLLLAAVAAHLALGVAILARVLRGEGHRDMLGPPLLFPLVGNIVAPLVAAPLGMPMLAWMLLGLGGTLWVAFMPLLLWRLIEGPRLPAPLRPSLAILLAPPTVGSLAVAALVGVGPGVWALYGLALFVLAMLAVTLGGMLEAGFTPAVWAFTFPLANFASVTLLLAPGWIAWPVLLAVTAVILLIAGLTLAALRGGRLLRPPAPA